MPTYKGVEVWIEDSEDRKLNHREVTIDLVNDRTVTVKTEMSKNEFYTIHCVSPISVFCDVFVITEARTQKRAARFYLDKSLTVSSNAFGSSVNHTEAQYRSHGLKTPKRQLKCGGLGAVEVEIRRIGEIIKAEPREEYEVDGGEEVATELSMIDDFDQPPWLVFHFNIGFKESPPAVLAPAAKHITRHLSRRPVKNRSRPTSVSRSRISGTERSSSKPSREAGYGCLQHPRKRRRGHDDLDEPANAGEGLGSATSDRLHEEYQQEEAEERRLMRKLQERLQIKKIRNIELRRLLGEAS